MINKDWILEINKKIKSNRKAEERLVGLFKRGRLGLKKGTSTFTTI